MTSRAVVLVSLAALLAGCNSYELFRVSGFQQESFTNDADILFVIDNSLSMTEESSEMAVNFDVFIEALAGSQSNIATDGLPDAVDNYIEFASRRTTFLDFRIGVTSTDVAAKYGGLYGDPQLLAFGDPDVPDSFRQTVLCEATYFDQNTITQDPAYTCGDPVEVVSEQYLDCLCGEDAWMGHSGVGNEEGLEAVLMAMCRAVPEPPEACFDEIDQFSEADILSNDGLLRDGSAFIPVIVSDEGDVSRRLSQGEGQPDEYARLFRQFDHRMAWAVIGPTSGECDLSAPVPGWAEDRYRFFVEETGGLYVPIGVDEGSGCEVTDFAAALEQLGDLVNSLRASFPLQAIPDPETILAFVDGEEVHPAIASDDGDGGVIWSDGWSYDPEDNAVTFHGEFVPDYNESVRIYYKPLSGMPRELPF